MLEQFYAETFNRLFERSDKGLISYSIYPDKSAYIHVAYIDPKWRNTGEATKLENAIIDKHKLNIIYCFVDLASNNPEASLIPILKNNYKIYESRPDKIILRKDINNGN